MKKNIDKLISWSWSLSDPDPIRRVALGGLYRYLKYGAGTLDEAGNTVFPAVANTTVQVTITENALSIHGTLMGVRKLCEGMIGTLTRGVIIPPGYPLPHNPEGFPSLRAHLGIATLFSGGQSTAKRTKTLGKEPEVKVSVSFQKALADALGRAEPSEMVSLADLYQGMGFPGRQDQLLREVGYGVSEKDGEESNMRKTPVTPHIPNPVLLNGQEVYLQKGFDYEKHLKGSAPLHSGFHPAFGVWNNKSVPGSPEGSFLLAFSPYGYIYSFSDEGSVGLGVDGDTFEEIDNYHTVAQNVVNPERQDWSGSLWMVHDTGEVAAMSLAAALRFPADRDVLILQDTSTPWKVLQVASSPMGLVEAFRKALREAISFEMRKNLQLTSKGQYTLPTLRLIRLTPPRQDKKKKKEDKKAVPPSIFSVVNRNLQEGQFWGNGLGQMAPWFLEWNDGAKYPKIGGISDYVTRLVHAMVQEGSMEDELMQEFGALFKSLCWVHANHTFERRPENEKWVLARKRAYQDVFVKCGLKQALTNTDILRVLSLLSQEANAAYDGKYPLKGISPKVLSFVRTADPLRLQALLTLALTPSFDKKSESTESKESI